MAAAYRRRRHLVGEHDDEFQRRQQVPDGQDLLGLRHVGHEDAARPGVLQDEARLLPREGRIDRHRDQPRGHDAHVGDDPLLARLGHDRDAVARLQPHVRQRQPDRPHALDELVGGARPQADGRALLQEVGSRVLAQQVGGQLCE